MADGVGVGATVGIGCGDGVDEGDRLGVGAVVGASLVHLGANRNNAAPIARIALLVVASILLVRLALN